MLRILLLACSLIFISESLYAQFSDSTHYHIRANLSGNINKTTGSPNYLFNNGVKFSIRRDKIEWNTSGNWLYGENAGVLVNNDFSSTTDFNIYHKKDARFNYWGLLNYVSSYSLKISSQFQAGAGVAYEAIDKEAIMLRLSDGLLYETSSIVRNDTTVEHYETIRNSLRIQLQYNFRKLITLKSTIFWQPSLLDQDDYIVKLNTGLNVKVWKWLSFTTGLNYVHISRTQRENILITYGAVFEQYF